MSIQIIDNFELTTAKPIDNRLVVGVNSFYTNKDNIPNKYDGMRVWELPGSDIGGGLTNSTANGLGYVWTGTTWVSENTTSISGGGDSGRVPYFNSTNSIQSSNIYYDGTNIGIGGTAETGSGSSKLIVQGSIKSSGGYFIGNAWDSSTSTGLSNLNASNLSVGTVPIGRFPTSTTGWILTADATAASYKDPSSITVGTASALQTTRTIWGQNFNGTGNVTGNITGAGTIQFGTQVNKATLTYTTNVVRNLTVPSLSGNSTFAFLEQTQTWTSTNTFEYIRTNQSNETTYNSSGTYPLRVGYGQILSLGANSTIGGLIQTWSGKDLRLNTSGNNVIIGDYSGATSKLAINQNSPTYHLELGYNSAAKPSSTVWTILSDSRLKENIVDADLDRCLEIVDNLPLRKYTWKREYYKDEQISNDRSKIGWIADEVETYFPKAVNTISSCKLNGNSINDLKTLDSDQIYAVLYGAVKKLINDNKNLKKEIEDINRFISSQTTN